MSINESFNKLDLSGKLIIKACYGDDIRRIPIHNDDLTYDELVLMMQRVFKGSLDPDEEILLKYRDEDEDLITITDNSDLSFAIQYCRVLRLTILTENNNKTADTAAAPHNLKLDKSTIKQLREVRDVINRLLDTTADTAPALKDPVESAEVPQANSEQGGKQTQVFNGFKEESKEFDPLTQEFVSQDAVRQDVDQQSISSHSSAQPEPHTELAPPTSSPFPTVPAPNRPPSVPPTQHHAPAPGAGPAHPPQAQPGNAAGFYNQMNYGANPAYPPASQAATGLPQQPAAAAYTHQAAPGPAGQLPPAAGPNVQQPASQQPQGAPRPAYPPPGANPPAFQPAASQAPTSHSVAAGYPAAVTSQAATSYSAPAGGPGYAATATTAGQPAAPPTSYGASPGYPTAAATSTGYPTTGYQFPGYNSPAAPPANPYSRAAPGAGYNQTYQSQQGYK